MAVTKVKLFANLRETAGATEVIVSGDHISEILEDLVTEYPALKELIFEDSDHTELRGYINVLINGDNVQHLQGLETSVNAGDEIAIFPPVSGG
ncbi:MAG: ubiquitin-like small modifier protein 1 [Methanosarcinaceae archaeon]